MTYENALKWKEMKKEMLFVDLFHPYPGQSTNICIDIKRSSFFALFCRRAMRTHLICKGLFECIVPWHCTRIVPLILSLYFVCIFFKNERFLTLISFLLNDSEL